MEMITIPKDMKIFDESFATYENPTKTKLNECPQCGKLKSIRKKYCSKNCYLIPRDGKHLVTHGKTKTQEYRLYFLAKQRANQKNINFNLDVDDIIIPEYCPILNLKLIKNHKGWAPDAPTLDRIIPEKGYVKGNVKVISGKANVMKNNATLKELKVFTENIFKYLQE
jgi:hypothetical protein